MKRQPAKHLSLLVFAVLVSSQQLAQSQPAKLPTDSSAAASVSASAPGPVAPVIPPLSESLTGTAKADYESGKLLFKDNDYSGALLKFKRAYEESHDGRLLWNMAVCEKNLRHYARVGQLAEQYRKEAARTMTDSERDEVTELLRAVKSLVSPLIVTVDQSGAAVFVDDEPVGSTPIAQPIIVDMGTRKVRVTKAGFRTVDKLILVSGTNEVAVQVKMVAEVHEGRLVVVVQPDEIVSLDGRIVGQGRWEGTVRAGGHLLRVTGAGRRAFQGEVVVRDGDRREIRPMLDVEKEAPSAGVPTWVWVAGGVMLAGGAAVGGYFLFRPKDEAAPPPISGTIQPGTIQLPLLGNR